MSAEDPRLSAVVELLPADRRTTETPDSSIDLSEDLRAIGLAKARFTAGGFEVHAPMGLSFSIGANRSLFEEFFSTEVVVDDSELVRKVTNAEGGLDLPLGAVSEELRGLVASVRFVAPPDLFAVGGAGQGTGT